LDGQPCDDLQDEAQLGVQTPREDCTAVRSRNFGGQDHSASGHAQRYAQFVRDPSLLVMGRPVTVSLKEIALSYGISEPADWKLQLIDSTSKFFFGVVESEMQMKIARARKSQRSPNWARIQTDVQILEEVGSREKLTS
jgi:hypothetical protein